MLALTAHPPHKIIGCNLIGVASPLATASQPGMSPREANESEELFSLLLIREKLALKLTDSEGTISC